MTAGATDFIEQHTAAEPMNRLHKIRFPRSAAVFVITLSSLSLLAVLSGCKEKSPPPNARDTLEKNQQSLSDSLDKFQVEDDARDKPAGAPATPADPAKPAAPAATTPAPKPGT
jgi:hypothetical protein